MSLANMIENGFLKGVPVKNLEIGNTTTTTSDDLNIIDNDITKVNTIYADQFISPNGLILNTDGSDQSVVINNMIDNLDNLGGGLILLPRGVYTISNQIVMKPNVILKGQGKATEIKLIDNASNGGFDMIFMGASDRCSLRDLFINGNKNNGNTVGACVSVFKTYGATMFNVEIHDSAQDGIICNGDTDRKSSILLIRDCRIERAGRHSIHHGPYSQDAWIIETYTQDAAEYGLYVNASARLTSIDSHYYRNGTSNVHVFDAFRVILRSCNMDSAQEWGIILEGCIGCDVVGNLLFDNNLANSGGGNFGHIQIKSSINRATSTCLISGNILYDENGATTRYGIEIDDDSEKNTIIGNSIKDIVTSDFNVSSTAASKNVIIHTTKTNGEITYLNNNESTSKSTGSVVLNGGLAVNKVSNLSVVFADSFCGLIQKVIPVNAGTTTINNDTSALILDAGATITSHTINLPSAPRPGQVLKIVSADTITSVTTTAPNTNGLRGGSITTLEPGVGRELIYDSSGQYWYVFK